MAKTDDVAQRTAEADQYYWTEKHNRELADRIAALSPELRSERQSVIASTDARLKPFRRTADLDTYTRDNSPSARFLTPCSDKEFERRMEAKYTKPATRAVKREVGSVRPADIAVA